MNNVRSLVQLTRGSSGPHPVLYSEHMLAELLALHGEMIEQLRLERLGSQANTAFLTALIEQHEKTAAMLRTRLEYLWSDRCDTAARSPPPR